MFERKKMRVYVFPLLLVVAVLTYFLVIHSTYPNTSTSEDAVIPWMMDSWKAKYDMLHGWAVPLLFVVFISMSWKEVSEVKLKGAWVGLLIAAFGIIIYLASARTLQPRVALFGFPFLIIGSVVFVCGWGMLRYIWFPAFFWYFAISVPGLQQATSVLQIFISESCYAVGSALGIQLTLSGNDLSSATGSWDSLNIAEGCSGIRSLMALVMISAIYAYLTQKKLWKMAFLFACALPLAVLANFLRIFTIILLAEFGFSKFAAGVYHDWAGLLFFFPIALAGLFLIDRLLNWKEHRKVARVRTVGGADSVIR